MLINQPAQAGVGPLLAVRFTQEAGLWHDRKRLLT